MINRALGLSLATAALMFSTAAVALPDGADPAHTGSQGEPDCSACHFGGANPSEVSGIELMDLAEQMMSGKTYSLRFRVRDPEQQVGGFQVAVRDPKTGQSRGELKASASQRVARQGEVDYLTHREPQSATTEQAEQEPFTEWQIKWTAVSAGAVELAIAAIAADGDNSPIGDNVYTFSREIQVD